MSNRAPAASPGEAVQCPISTFDKRTTVVTRLFLMYLATAVLFSSLSVHASPDLDSEIRLPPPEETHSTPESDLIPEIIPQPDLTPEEEAILQAISQPQQHHEPLTVLSKKIEIELSNLFSFLQTKQPELNSQLELIMEMESTLFEETKALVQTMVPEKNRAEISGLIKRVKDVYDLEMERRTMVKALKDDYYDDDDDDDDDEDWVTKEELEQAISIDSITYLSEEIAREYVLQLLLAKWNEAIQNYEESQKILEREKMERLRGKVNADIMKLNEVYKSNACVDKVSAANIILSSLEKAMGDGDGGVGGVGKYDHLMGGGDGSIVYGPEWTSDSYQAPTLTSPKYNGQLQTMETVPWRRYIPQDWERLLPQGWEEWQVPTDILDVSSSLPFLNDQGNKIQSLIPNYVWHSIPGPISSILGGMGIGMDTSTGIGGGASTILAPPETILSPNTQLGSCWAMSGPTGKITVRLPYPVAIDSVTLDHYPSSVLGYDGSSAPRFLRLVGYPPCSNIHDTEEEKKCAMMGFDVDDPIELGSFEYKIVSPSSSHYNRDGDQDGHTSHATRSIQTFEIGGVDDDESSKYFPSYDEIHEEDMSPPAGSCGATAATNTVSSSPGGSCSAPSLSSETSFGIDDDNNYEDELKGRNVDDDSTKIVVEAVTLYVEENWGNPDFTCLYRFRIHGTGEI